MLPRRGSNPCITYLADLRIGNHVLPSELHGIPYIVYLLRGSCRCQTLPKILGYSLMTYSEPRSICFVLFHIRIPAAHSAFILSHHSLGLTLLPSHIILCISGPSRGRCGVRNLPYRLWLYLRILYRLFHSFSLSVSFDAVSIRYTYRLAPWLLYLLSDLNK